MLSTLLSYIDRQVLAVLSPTILLATGLSANAYANAISAFSIAYMIGNPLWGSVLDFVGLRLGMLIAVGLWTAASASHAWVTGFVGFAVARAVLGFGEGAAFPGALRTAAEALPPNRQSRGMALGYSGASLGAIITPLIVTPIALKYGWQTAFLITGTFGAAVVDLMAGGIAATLPADGQADEGQNYLAESPRASSLGRRREFRAGRRRAWHRGIPESALFESRAGIIAGAARTEFCGFPWSAGSLAISSGAGSRIGIWPTCRTVAVLRSCLCLLTVLALPSVMVTQTHSVPVVLALFFWATFVAEGSS